MKVFLEGVAAQFYRGIGAETQFIAPFGAMNFFIGANNAGKSVVLNLIKDHVKTAVEGKLPVLKEGAEVYKGTPSGQFLIALGCDKERILEKVLSQIADGHTFSERSRSTEERELIPLVFDAASKNGALWVAPVGGPGRSSLPGHKSYPDLDEEQSAVLTKAWFDFRQRIGNPAKHEAAGWKEAILNGARQHILPALPKIHLVPAKRSLGEKDQAYTDLSGKGLLDELAKLQAPALEKQEDGKKFERINKFLQEVTGKHDAKLSVPFEDKELLIHMDNKVLPLSSLGTGIHEVILLAAFSTIHDGSIMCIEEPEIHLHPVLQRKLIAYLADNTSSQYFIATHSAAFMDAPNANIFHVANDGVQTRVTAALTKNCQRRILDDLGYHASDILQANAVIWVEGPSDRIYLNHWIRHLDDRLKEGIHYSIMFYGGGLISHLSALDDAVDKFIELRRLNRNTAIVLDSDRESADAPLKSNAQRIVDEMGKDGGIVWVTAGREVENYVDGDRIQAALKAIHPRLYKAPCPTGPFDHAFYFLRDKPGGSRRETFKDGNKVEVARRVTEDPVDLDRLDLREKLSALCLMISKANGMEPKGIN